MDDGSGSRLSYEVFPLSLLLSPEYGSVAAAVRAELDSFDCERSSHIQEFARSAVHKWEKHGHSRTYLLVSVTEKGIAVPGFFTVGMTMLDLREASSSSRKKLMGEVSMNQTGAFSIAELARSDRYTAAQLPGTIILDEAKEVIRRARSYIGGRFLVVDSRPEIFERLYAPAGFKKVSVATPPVGMEGTDFVTSCCVIKDWKTEP